jgi:hypothetical protein
VIRRFASYLIVITAQAHFTLGPTDTGALECQRPVGGEPRRRIGRFTPANPIGWVRRSN